MICIVPNIFWIEINSLVSPKPITFVAENTNNEPMEKSNVLKLLAKEYHSMSDMLNK
jgi:hypothetical protein